VGLIDSGELAAGCYLLNILHPTGYPLYTMLGRLASLVPLGSVVNRLAAFSAFTAAAGIGLLLWLYRRLGISPVASGVTALLMGISLPVWSVAVDVEVYALTLVMSALLLLAAGTTPPALRLYLFSYLSGLALTNHLSAASIVAGAGLIVLLEQRREAVRQLPRIAVLFLLGISPYLFLVLRARAGPLLAWGNPVTLERLWWHITGKQYQVWMFRSSLGEMLANAGRGAILLGRSFGLVFVPAVVVGMIALWRQRRLLFLGLTAGAILAYFYAVNYSIPDIEAYYLPALVALAVLCAVGLDRLLRRMGRWQHLCWLPVAGVLLWNLPDATRRGDYVAYDQAMNTLTSADTNAVILTDWWDLYAPVFYLQNVEGVRSDVCIIDKELVRRSWYLEYMAKEYPSLMTNSRFELERYRPLLDDFEHGRLRDTQAIQAAFIDLLRRFLFGGHGRPAYTSFAAEVNEDARQLLRGARPIPVGILFLVNDTVVPPFDYSKFTVRIPRRRIDRRTRASLDRYYYFTAMRIPLLLHAGRASEAAATGKWWQTTLGDKLVPAARIR
ncbi:MAG: DUF2723 domain-containing protein, partial [candidate division WOR-3 bacterium]